MAIPAVGDDRACEARIASVEDAAAEVEGVVSRERAASEVQRGGVVDTTAPLSAPLPTRVLSVTVAVPSLKMAPPVSAPSYGKRAVGHRQGAAGVVEDASTQTCGAVGRTHVLPVTFRTPPTLEIPPPGPLLALSVNELSEIVRVPLL